MPCISKENLCPPWMSQEEYLHCLTRLGEIDDKLSSMGASKHYCSRFFQQAAGVCVQYECGQCKKHQTLQPPLPDHIMCSVEFGKQAAFLRSQVGLSYLSVCLDDVLTPVDRWQSSR